MVMKCYRCAGLCGPHSCYRESDEILEVILYDSYKLFIDQICILIVLNRSKLMRKPNQTENEISPTFSNFVPAISKRVSTQFERQLPEIIHVNIDEKHKIRYKRGYGGFPDRADVV